MLEKVWRLVFVAALIFLPACNSKATPTKEPPCLVGTWLLAEDEQFARAVLPPGAFDPDSLRYRGSAGIISYGFSQDGKGLVQAIKWTGRFDVRAEQSLMALDLFIDGAASANYSLEGDTLKLTSEFQNKINFVATLDKESMMDTLNPQDFVPLFVEPFTSAKVVCSKDSLSLEILNLPTAQKPFTFVRVVKDATPQP